MTVREECSLRGKILALQQSQKFLFKLITPDVARQALSPGSAHVAPSIAAEDVKAEASKLPDPDAFLDEFVKETNKARDQLRDVANSSTVP